MIMIQEELPSAPYIMHLSVLLVRSGFSLKPFGNLRGSNQGDQFKDLRWISTHLIFEADLSCDQLEGYPSGCLHQGGSRPSS